MGKELYDDSSASERISYVRSKIMFLEEAVVKGVNGELGTGRDGDSANSGEGLELILHGIGEELHSIEKQVGKKIEEAKAGGAE